MLSQVMSLLINIILMLSTQPEHIFLFIPKKELPMMILVKLKMIKLWSGFREVLDHLLNLETMKKLVLSELITKLKN